MRAKAHAWPGRHLVLVIGATLLVAVSPVAVVWWLRSSGTVASPLVGVLLATALSLVVSALARAGWEKHKGSDDLLFSELMLWGFMHRWLTQRRLSSALDLLGPLGVDQSSAIEALDTRERAKLLETLVSSIEKGDPYTHGHSRRVARHSWMIARRMGLSREEVARIRTAAAIHDVGKLETPKAILHKAGRLTDDEYAVIKRHPVDGARMSEVLRDPELTAAVLHHHERMDGTGYPSGLSGQQIPIGARIISVADTFDAITSQRPYRALRSHREAIDILRGEAGTQLDPVIVRAFCRHYAGRRPLAAWSIVAGLPERVVAWLGSGVATAASVAKAVAVVSLVGGAAVTASTAAGPHQKHRVSVAHAASVQAAGIAELAHAEASAPRLSHRVGPGSSANGSPLTARPRKSIPLASYLSLEGGHSGAADGSAAHVSDKGSGSTAGGGSGSSSGGGEGPTTTEEGRKGGGEETSAKVKKEEAKRAKEAEKAIHEQEKKLEHEAEKLKNEEAALLKHEEEKRRKEEEKVKREEERKREREEQRQREREAAEAKGGGPGPSG